jgi:hypothetical protein
LAVFQLVSLAWLWRASRVQPTEQEQAMAA